MTIAYDSNKTIIVGAQDMLLFELQDIRLVLNTIQRKPRRVARPQTATKVLALNKAHVIALNTAHGLCLNTADALALNKANIL